MKKMLLKVTSFFLIQLLMLGSVAQTANGVVCLAKSVSFKAEEYNLSPRIYVDSMKLHDIFIKAVAAKNDQIIQASKLFKSTDNSTAKSVSIKGDQNKQRFFKKVIAYALRKKQENQGKGFFKQDVVYLLLKRSVDKLEKRNKPYKVKDKQRKKFLRDISRLKTRLIFSRKWLKTDLWQQYEKKVNNLEKLLDAVQTHGDWDDLIALGTKLNKDVSKHGALARELNYLARKSNEKKTIKPRKITLKDPADPKEEVLSRETQDEIIAAALSDANKLLRERKTKNKKTIKPRKITLKDPADPSEEVLPQETQNEIIDVAYIELIEPVNEDQLDQQSTHERKTEEFKGGNLFTGSARKPILEKAIEKLIETYNLTQEDLPYEITLGFQLRIEQLQQSIVSMQKGQFSALKQELRTLENNLLQAVKQHKNAKAAALQRKRVVKKPKNGNKARNRNNGTKAAVNAKKQTKEKDLFAQAVTLYDPEKIKVRSIDEVIGELRGQTGILKQIIEAELQHTFELHCYNGRREVDEVVIQVNYSEALKKIEVGSDMVMELSGQYYELKCAQILNSGSKLILKPANKDGIFPHDFPSDIRGAKFFYIPNTHSEDLQKKVLKEIAIKISGEGQSTGIKVLDYFLRIKSTTQDIKNIKQLKESLVYTNGLDMFQKAAVNLIVKTRFGLILGPFGTGKTRVLLAGAKNLVLKSKKPVFIVAPQHKIADDITLKAGKCNIPVLRCGNKTNKFDPAIRDKYGRHSEIAQTEFIRRYKELNTGDEDNGCLFVGTNLGASFDWLVQELRNPDSAAFFKDVTLIVDEAALINYPELVTAIYILRPDALILVGDHVQFSPYKLVSRFSRQIMSIFERKIPQKAMWRYHNSSFKELISMPFNKVKLLINYRNPWISVDFLKKWYEGILTLQSISKKRGDIVDEDTFVIEDTSTWEKQSPEEFCPGTDSYCNKTEALWILKRIKYFLDKGYAANDIAIITYYDGQIRLITDFVDADGDISSADAQILKRNIFTPIRFQGAEKKIILSSLVRSKNLNNNSDGNYNGKNLNPLFISEPEFAKAEALLVLLSRHKGKLSLIGNRETLDALTKHRYKRINYFYSSLFSYKDKIKAYLDVQNIELAEKTEEDIRNYDFIRVAI